MTVNSKLMKLFPGEAWVTITNNGSQHLSIPAAYSDHGVQSENLIRRHVGWELAPAQQATILKRDYDAVANSAYVVAHVSLDATYNQDTKAVANQTKSYLILDDGKQGVTLHPQTGSNEVQSVKVDATGGTFTLTYSGQTTSALAFNVSTAALKTALEVLSNIAVDDVAVTGGPGDAGGTTPYVVTFRNALGEADVAAMTGDGALLTGGAATVTITTTTAGVAGKTYNVSLDTQEKAEAGAFASSLDLKSTTAASDPQAVTYMYNLTNNHVMVEEVGRHRGAGVKVLPNAKATAVPNSALNSSDNSYAGILTDTPAAVTVSAVTSPGVGQVRVAGTSLLDVDKLVINTTQASAAAVNIATTTPGVLNTTSEVQTLTLANEPTGGTWTITFSGQTTSALAYNATAAAVQAALWALSNVADGDVTVTRSGTGTATDPYVYTLTWLNSLGDVAQPTADASSLTQAEAFTYYNPAGPHSASNPAVTTVTWTDTQINVTDTSSKSGSGLSGERVTDIALYDANGHANQTNNPADFNVS